jgi:asparagine synthase (glutamine-hydrolysing)
LETKGDPEAVYAVLRGMFILRQRQELLGAEAPAPGGTARANSALPRANWSEADPVNLYSTLELSHYLPQTLLRDTDAMSMAHSLEVRVPLLDHLVVEQVARMPGNLKIRRQENKPLLVNAVGSLPRSITGRAKMGFTLPLGKWLRGGLRGWAESLLLSEEVGRLGILNAGAVRNAWGSFLQGESYTSYSRVWCLLALVAWCQEHGVGM